MENKIVKDSFLVLSDFHSNKEPLEMIKEDFINKYDKIFILGDTTDRGKENNGKGGLDMLLEIMTLSKKYPDRIIYIPGNHDQFIYKYLLDKHDERNNINIYNNGGRSTYYDLVNLKTMNPILMEELKDWLGNLPIQYKHKYKDVTYCLAHAFFDESLYTESELITLKSVEENPNRYKELVQRILWFRKGEDNYPSYRLPSKDNIEIIGHTPIQLRKNINIDLVNSNNETVKVYCVDSGLQISDILYMYDGDKGLISTEIKNNSNNYSYQKEEKYPQRWLDKCILSYLKKPDGSINDIIESLMKINYYGCKISNRSTKFYKELYDNGLTTESIENKEFDISNFISGKEMERNGYSLEKVLRSNIIELGINIIIISMLKTFDCDDYNKIYNDVLNQFMALYEYNDSSYITSKGNARTIMCNLFPNGKRDINRMLNGYDYKEYIKELLFNYYKKYYLKRK